MSELPTVIIIRLSALGDVLLTATLVQELARTYRVIFITSPAYVNLVAQMPGIGEVQAMPKNVSRNEMKRLGASLSDLKPHLVLDLQHKPKTMMFARMIKSRHRRSLAKRTFVQGVQSLFGHDTILDNVHQTQRYLSVLPQTHPISDNATVRFDKIPDVWRAAGADFIGNDTVPSSKPYVGFAFAATHATKGWSASSIAQTMRQLASEVQWVLLGGPTDVPQLEMIRAEGLPAATLDTCSSTLETLAGIIQHLDLVIGVDTGPVHLARLLNVKTLSLFGPTSVNRWGPNPDDQDTHQAISLQLECQPCSNHGGVTCPLSHHKCMNDITPISVVHKVSKMLELKL